MSRRRRAGLGFIALGTAALALVLSASAVHADAPQQTGWWFELQTSSLPAPLPAVPAVPDGGMFVQQGPQGPTAYGALRYETANAAKASLILVTAAGSTTSLGTPVEACATTAPWEAPQPSPGNWEDAPKYGDPCSPGRISADGKAVAFDLGKEFIRNDVIDVAIVPIEGSNPFALTFEKPGPDSLKVQSAPQPPSPSVSTAPSAPAAAGVATRPAVAAPVTPAAPAPTSAPAAPVTENRPALANAALNIAGLGDPDRGERALALSGASAIVIGWWLLSTRTVRMPRLIGAIGGQSTAEPAGDETKRRIGGVGRFARNREHNPATLR